PTDEGAPRATERGASRLTAGASRTASRSATTAPASAASATTATGSGTASAPTATTTTTNAVLGVGLTVARAPTPARPRWRRLPRTLELVRRRHRPHDVERRRGDPAMGEPQHSDLVVLGQVAEVELEEEAVELRLGQRVGALVLDGVLRREHEERRGEGVRLA